MKNIRETQQLAQQAPLIIERIEAARKLYLQLLEIARQERSLRIPEPAMYNKHD